MRRPGPSFAPKVILFRFYAGVSMRGTFRPGDRLTLEPVAIEEVRPGDIVVFANPLACDPKEELVHRVIAKTREGLVTRGDGNRVADETAVSGDALVGRVLRRERKGRQKKVKGGRWGRLHALGFRLLFRATDLPKSLCRPLYFKLRKSGAVARWWKPSFRIIRFASPEGAFVKYLVGGRTVAIWWPEKRKLNCRKPYDLVLWLRLVGPGIPGNG